MTWMIFVAGAVLSWGVYGVMLHQGQIHARQPAEGAALRGRRLFPGRRPRAGRRRSPRRATCPASTAQA